MNPWYKSGAVKIVTTSNWQAERDKFPFVELEELSPTATIELETARGHVLSLREGFDPALLRRVLEALERNGLEDNTQVLFTSDNGGAGYIGLPDVNDPFRGWKISLFEGGIHVPYFAKWPKRIAPGTRIAEPVHHFDLYATAAAAGGASLPDDRKMDGVDLLPYATGEKSGAPHRALFWRSGASQSALVDGWKLNVSNPPGRSWLFDMNADPNEQHDLSTERPEKLAELQAALAAHNAEQAPPAWPAQVAMAVNIDKDLSVPDEADDEYIYWSN